MPNTSLTPETVTVLYEQHGATLVAYARSYGLDFASAEDIVQQFFLKLLRGNVSTVESPVAYLYRSIRNAALNDRRNRRRQTELGDEPLWFARAGADPAEVVALQRALGQLPEEQREAVFLRIWAGMTLQEIASALDISLNTIASRYRYALEKLREHLGAGESKTGINHASR